jgi:hypothetical protein
LPRRIGTDIELGEMQVDAVGEGAVLSTGARWGTGDAIGSTIVQNNIEIRQVAIAFAILPPNDYVSASKSAHSVQVNLAAVWPDK